VKTELLTKVTIKNLIPNVHVEAFALPGCDDVICLQFTNRGNPDVPQFGLQNALLVREGALVHKLEEDYTVYPIPINYDEIFVFVSVGIINSIDVLAAQMTISTPSGGSRIHKHISCELN
jgi:hypothetical protein